MDCSGYRFRLFSKIVLLLSFNLCLFVSVIALINSNYVSISRFCIYFDISFRGNGYEMNFSSGMWVKNSGDIWVDVTYAASIIYICSYKQTIWSINRIKWSLTHPWLAIISFYTESLYNNYWGFKDSLSDGNKKSPKSIFFIKDNHLKDINYNSWCD